MNMQMFMSLIKQTIEKEYNYHLKWWYSDYNIHIVIIIHYNKDDHLSGNVAGTISFKQSRSNKIRLTINPLYIINNKGNSLISHLSKSALAQRQSFKRQKHISPGDPSLMDQIREFCDYIGKLKQNVS